MGCSGDLAASSPLAPGSLLGTGLSGPLTLSADEQNVLENLLRLEVSILLASAVGLAFYEVFDERSLSPGPGKQRTALLLVPKSTHEEVSITMAIAVYRVEWGENFHSFSRLQLFCARHCCVPTRLGGITYLDLSVAASIARILIPNSLGPVRWS